MEVACRFIDNVGRCFSRGSSSDSCARRSRSRLFASRVDGQIHKLSDYASSPILVVVFTCNHCPIAQMYEKRIQQLAKDYKDKGVAVVAIQGNDPQPSASMNWTRPT